MLSQPTAAFVPRAPFILLATGLALGAPALAQPQMPPLRVDENGTVHMPAMSVPISDYLSPEGRAYVADHLKKVQQLPPNAAPSGTPALIAPYVGRMRELYSVGREDTQIAGVTAYVYKPNKGIAPQNRSRVLINLHGGAFRECFPGCAELESIPISALMGVKVISLDYRQGPTHRFPAASEDVAAVYKELLKTYPPENIGIYGCSAGGMLTGMSIAWFQKQGLPRPGAAGILCAGSTLSPNGFGGDGAYTALPLGEARMPPPAQRSAGSGVPPLPYLIGTRSTDPLVAPASSPEVLAGFPPTLIITGTRAFELSSAIYTHSQLVKQHVDADLHVWEGMFHGFFYNPDVPESRDAYDVITRFFDRHLGK